MSTAGSYNHLLNIHNNSEQCLHAFLPDYCNYDSDQEYADLAFRCDDIMSESLRPQARLFRDTCSLNSNREFCSGIVSHAIALSKNVGFSCNSSITCSPDCRLILNIFLEELGCCVNFFNNTDDSSADVFHPRGFQYSLWSLCGLEPVTEVCTSVSNPSDLSKPADPTCTEAIFLEQLASITCRRINLESAREVLGYTEGCENFYEDIIDVCAANEFGRHCFFSLPILLPMLMHYFNLLMKCVKI